MATWTLGALGASNFVRTLGTWTLGALMTLLFNIKITITRIQFHAHLFT